MRAHFFASTHAPTRKRDALAVTASKLTGNIWSGSFFVLGAKADIVQRVEVDHGP